MTSPTTPDMARRMHNARLRKDFEQLCADMVAFGDKTRHDKAIPALLQVLQPPRSQNDKELSVGPYSGDDGLRQNKRRWKIRVIVTTEEIYKES